MGRPALQLNIQLHAVAKQPTEPSTPVHPPDGVAHALRHQPVQARQRRVRKGRVLAEQ